MSFLKALSLADNAPLSGMSSLSWWPPDHPVPTGKTPEEVLKKYLQKVRHPPDEVSPGLAVGGGIHPPHPPVISPARFLQDAAGTAFWVPTNSELVGVDVLGHSCGLTSHTCLFSKLLTGAQLSYREFKQGGVISYGTDLKMGLMVIRDSQPEAILQNWREEETLVASSRPRPKMLLNPPPCSGGPGTAPAAKNCFCSVAESCLTLCGHVDWSLPGSPVLHCLPEFAQSRVH